MRVTTKQIAEEAGVSMTTVTNVLNNRTERVSKKTQEKVQSVIDKYQYIPNMNARSLASSRSGLIGLIYFSENENIDFSDPFVSEILEGIENITRANDYFVLVHNILDVSEIKRIQKYWKFEGFLIVGASSESVINISEAVHRETPVVFIDSHFNVDNQNKLMKKCYFVATDDYEAGRKAAQFLVSKGHRRIAFISYPYSIEYPNVIYYRKQGINDILKEEGIERKSMDGFISTNLDQVIENIGNFTAIIASSDLLAMELIQKLKEKNIDLDNSISIMGFDDLKYSKYIEPSLTTIAIKNINKGEVAASKLINLLKGEEESLETLLDCKLVERDSVFIVK